VCEVAMKAFAEYLCSIYQWFSNFMSPRTPRNTLHTQGPFILPRLSCLNISLKQIQIK
jgi:hypothetical protein